MTTKDTVREVHYAFKALSSVLFFSMALLLITNLMVSDTFAFGGRRGPDPERMLEHLSEDLNLSDDQVDQVRPILEDQAERMKAVFEDDSLRGDRAARREQMDSIREETELQMESVLTEAQMELFRELPRKRMREGKRRAEIE